MARPKKNLLSTTFIDATETMSDEELRNEVLKASANVDEIIEAREANQDFQALKEKYQDANGGYRDGINAEKAKADYVKLVLKQRGKTVPTTTPFVPLKSVKS